MNEIPHTDEPSAEQKREQHHAAADALGRVNGALELHAALLALMLPAGSRRAARAWAAEADASAATQALREHAGHLLGNARLPWFELLLSRMRRQPLPARQALLEASRRVMQARGSVRPIDTLHWLAMRQRLGGNAAVKVKNAASVEISQLSGDTLQAIASYTAFLSRMVPTEALDTSTPTARQAWYASVMAPWQASESVPDCLPPDGDALVTALHELQVLAWMQRPVLVRGWFDAAVAHSLHRRLGDGAADALRLSCTLLDSPVPPALAKHFIEAVKP
ncbi:MAG: hypothetical protein ABI433_14210 [Burkholderiaceae bacterium]